MAFSKSYIADTRALAVITQTVVKKTAILPGVTVKAELAGLVQANTAEYYYNLAPNVATVDAGADFSTTQAGSKKAVMPLTRGLHIDEKVPNVAIDATSADVVMDRMVKGALALSNRLGSQFIADLHALTQKVNLDASDLGLDGVQDIYGAVVHAMGDFAGKSSVNVGGAADTTFSNRTNGIQAKTILVGDLGRAKLMKSDAFQRTINATGEIPGLIGNMLGLDVVYSQDLAAVSATVDFILLDPEGVAYPYSINTLRVVESELFNGIRIQGEVGYPDAANYAVLPIDSFAIAYTIVA